MANTKYRMPRVVSGTTTSGVCYFIADTDAGKPVTGLNVGDLAYAVDSKIMYIANSATTWNSNITAANILVEKLRVLSSGTDGYAEFTYGGSGLPDVANIAIPDVDTGIMAVDTAATSWTALQTFTGVKNTATSVSATTTVTASHNTIYATVGVAGITLNLPAAATATIGQAYYAFKVDAGVGLLTIAPNGTNTLNGVAAAKTIANQFNGCRIQGLSTTGWLVTSFTGL